MSQLEWKQFKYENGHTEYIAKDRLFCYKLISHSESLQINGIEGGASFARCDTFILWIRRLDDLEWKNAFMPRFVLSVNQNRTGDTPTHDDVLRKVPCLENQIWERKGFIKGLEAVERWLIDYGYLKQLKKFEEGID